MGKGLLDKIAEVVSGQAAAPKPQAPKQEENENCPGCGQLIKNADPDKLQQASKSLSDAFGK
jgi:hypothetical protein